MPETRLRQSARTVLAVDDDRVMRELVVDVLEDAGMEVVAVSSVDDALCAAQEREFDVVLTDLQMPERDGLELVAALRELGPETPVVLMTAFGSVRTAVDAMRAGAMDFVTKPFEAETLLVALERAFEKREIEAENRQLRRALDRTSSFGDLVGKSAAMNEIYALIRKVASSSSNILITGESGTGKEVVARAIHFAGSRAEKPFVPINCTAMPEGLLESELFGHTRGAFTGAHRAKKGLFEAAHGGTILLDEIGDMPATLQGKLLRVLQDHEIRPVGSNQSIKVNARVIAATNQDLKMEIQEGRFRKDLYYRLNVIPIPIPPLRERREDIPRLAEAFLLKHARGEPRRLSEKTIQRLMGATWEGNARELENCVERALVLAEGSEIKPSDILLPDEPIERDETLEDAITRLAFERRMTLRDLTDLYVKGVLEATQGRKGDAAKILGMNRRTLYRREERQDGTNLQAEDG